MPEAKKQLQDDCMLAEVPCKSRMGRAKKLHVGSPTRLLGLGQLSYPEPQLSTATFTVTET